MDGQGFVIIPLSTKGKHAGKYIATVSLIDADIAQYNWNFQGDAKRTNAVVYATRTANLPGKPKQQRMHRLILERMLKRDLLSSEQVDHINGNGLDNRRENLRLATITQNHANRGLRRDNTSGYKGITWYARKNVWKALITTKRKTTILGYFTSPLEAHRAYCKELVARYGEYANFGATSPFTPQMFMTQEKAA